MRFFFFILTFFIIYGGMNAYVFWKARAALPLGLRGQIILALWFVLMVFAPILVRMAENYGMDTVGHILAWVGFTWFGFVFLFLSIGILFDLYRFALYFIGAIAKRDVAPLLPEARPGFYIPLILSLGILVYGWFEAWNIRTEHLTVQTEKLPEGVDQVRVAQISDVHVGLIVREKRVKAIMDRVREAQPDIFVSTGDLVDGQIDDISAVAAQFNDLNVRWGRYAVTGNHEYYAGLDHALSFTRHSGFTLLRGKTLEAGPIVIAGVDYPSDWTEESMNVNEAELLSSVPENRFVLFLKHIPRINQKSLGLFDLQLSGHTHKGQLFPFELMVRLSFPYIAGHYDLGKGSALYTSRGSGTWGPPSRFLSPPEVTVIDIVRK